MPNNATKYIAHKLRETRETFGLSQIQVAERLKKTQSFVSRCETGDRRLDIIELCQFARLYNKPMSYFLPPD